MSTIRPNATPAATSVAGGDIFLIDGATGVRALAASVVPLRDANGNVTINNVIDAYTTTATAAGTTTLTSASTRQQYFTGVTTQTVLLPVTSTLALGWAFSFVNSSTGAVTVQSSGANTVLVIAPGTSATIKCTAITGTTAASWAATYAANVIASGKSLTVNNSLTLAGTDATVMTFPATSATIARTDAGQTFTGTNAFGVLTATTVNGLTVTTSAGTLTIPNNASAILQMTGNFTLNLTATGASTATFPAGTHTLVGQDTTDTLTNKTFDSAGTGNSLKINGQSILTNTGTGSVNVLATNPAIVGTATNDNAAAGNYGEYIESVIVSGSAISTVSGTAKTVTSISLGAGDWDVSGNISFITVAGTSVTGLSASISGTTNVNDVTPGKFSGLFFGATIPGAATPSHAIPIGPYRLSLSGTTTVFLVQTSFYTAAALTAYGIIRARRVR